MEIYNLFNKKNLVAFYNENGYRDAKVLSDSVAFVEGSNKLLNLYIDIEEGNRYYFGDVTWIGNTKFPSELLDAVLLGGPVALAVKRFDAATMGEVCDEFLRI